MAKHAVPKRKAPKSQTSSRHKAFVRFNQKYWRDAIKIHKCPNCGVSKQLHHACQNCGMYRGRQIFNIGKATDKITKIKV